MAERRTHTIDDPDFDMRQHEPEQRNLFPTEDLIVPESLQKMRKAVAAIHAIPRNPEDSQNLTNRRVFDGLIIVAQIHCRQRGKEFIQRIRDERVSPLFEVRTSELGKLSGIPGKNYARIIEEINRIYEMDFEFNVCAEDGETIWENRARLLSSLGVGKNHKRGYIRFAMDPEMLILLLEPNLWASFSLSVMHDLGTSAAYALFQQSYRYINTNQKLTAALPTKTWIELLVGKNRYVKTVDGKEVINYGEFKRRVLNDAIEKVNEVPALSYKIELKEHRQGNRVARLQFKFIPKEPTLLLESTWPEDILSVLRSIGFHDKEIDDISQVHSSASVADAICRLKEAEQRMKAQGKAVSGRKPYFLGILRNIAAGEDDIDPEKIEAEVRVEMAERAAEERKKKMQDAFDEHRRKRFTAWVSLLSSEDRMKLVADYEASEDFSPVLGKSLKKGLSEENKSGLTTLRVWMEKHRPETMASIFDTPEYQSLEGWMMWKLSGDDAIES